MKMKVLHLSFKILMLNIFHSIVCYHFHTTRFISDSKAYEFLHDISNLYIGLDVDVPYLLLTLI